MKKRKWGLFYAALIIPQGRPDIEIKNFNLVESQSSIRSLEIQAQKAQLFQEVRTGLLHQVQSKVWSTGGNIYDLRAKIAVIDTSSQDFKTEGETSIITPDSYVLQTKNVRYNSNDRILSSVEAVVLAPLQGEKIKGVQDFNLKGDGLNILLKTDIFRIENNVKARQKLGPKQNLEITSKKFEFDSIRNLGRFISNVSVRHPEYTLQGHFLDLSFKKTSSDTSSLKEMFLQSTGRNAKVYAKIGETVFRSRGLKLFFDEESNIESSEAIGSAEAELGSGIMLKAEHLISFSEDGIQKIRMTGNVDIITSSRTANCEEALYIPSTGDFILEKFASLKDEDQIIEGDKIYFSTKHNRLKVVKATGTIGKEQIKKMSR